MTPTQHLDLLLDDPDIEVLDGIPVCTRCWTTFPTTAAVNRCADELQAHERTCSRTDEVNG